MILQPICKVAKDGLKTSLEEACCLQLGYTFVAENIGFPKITSFNLTEQAKMEEFNNQGEQTIVYYVLFFAIVILVLGLVALLIKQGQKG